MKKNKHLDKNMTSTMDANELDNQNETEQDAFSSENANIEQPHANQTLSINKMKNNQNDNRNFFGKGLSGLKTFLDSIKHLYKKESTIKDIQSFPLRSSIQKLESRPEMLTQYCSSLKTFFHNVTHYLIHTLVLNLTTFAWDLYCMLERTLLLNTGIGENLNDPDKSTDKLGLKELLEHSPEGVNKQQMEKLSEEMSSALDDMTNDNKKEKELEDKEKEILKLLGFYDEEKEEEKKKEEKKKEEKKEEKTDTKRRFRCPADIKYEMMKPVREELRRKRLLEEKKALEEAEKAKKMKKESPVKPKQQEKKPIRKFGPIDPRRLPHRPTSLWRVLPPPPRPRPLRLPPPPLPLPPPPPHLPPAPVAPSSSSAPVQKRKLYQSAAGESESDSEESYNSKSEEPTDVPITPPMSESPVPTPSSSADPHMVDRTNTPPLNQTDNINETIRQLQQELEETNKLLREATNTMKATSNRTGRLEKRIEAFEEQKKRDNDKIAELNTKRRTVQRKKKLVNARNKQGPVIILDD